MKRCSVVLLLGLTTAFGAEAQKSDQRESVGLFIAHEYIKAMEQNKLDTIDLMFLDANRSKVLENASDEGSWEHYRDHHLKPEMEASEDFKFTVREEKEERFGTSIIVWQTGRFSMKSGDSTRTFNAAVTYVIVKEGQAYKIAHLHWSSRPVRKPATP